MVANPTTFRPDAKPEPKLPRRHGRPHWHDAAKRAAVDFLHAAWMFVLNYPGPVRYLSLRIALVFQALNDALAFCMNGFKPAAAKAFNEEAYWFEPPKDPLTRSPCPALNSLANHGYLPRDGRKIDRTTMIHALQQGYNLSYLHAWFITTNGYLLTGQWKDMSLFDLCRHNGIEHNASLVHDDASPGQEYAPAQIAWPLFDALAAHSSDGGASLGLHDIARARVAREQQSSLDTLHAEIARGEIGLILDLFGGRRQRVLVDQLRTWWREERFPEGWRPPRAKQSLPRTIHTSQSIKQSMAAFRQAGASAQENVRENWLQTLCRLHLFVFERWNGSEGGSVWL